MQESGFEARLHETRSVWNQYEIGIDKPSVYTTPGRSAPGGGGAALSGDQVCMYPPANRKNKKNLDHLPLKTVKFEIFARVIG